MRIIQLHSENIKRVRAIDITPEGDIIVLSGLNGAGKTSVLDSIWLVFEYKAAKKNNPSPLRTGEDKGFIELDIGDYIVTRKFTPSGSTLSVRMPDGSTVKKPQQILDGLIGDLSFDPWEFSRKKDDQRREMLADVLYNLTEGKLDLASFDVERKAAYDARTSLNKDKKRLAALVTQMAPPLGTDPTEEISIEDLTKAITDAMTSQSRVNQLSTRDHDLKDKKQRLEKELDNINSELKLVTKELEDAPDIPDIEYLKKELSGIEQTNKRAREVIAYNSTRKDLATVNAGIEAFNDEMELIDINKAEALESSPLPVKGLRLTEEGVTVINDEGHEVPFCQASSAQQLRISLGIAMAANPKLRVIRIADGSLLDDNSMAIIKEMASDEDYQCWIEYASRNDSDRMGVYIEDGSVVEVTPNA
jgi:DNA repair exonuclease SbcCD ATPase subunit